MKKRTITGAIIFIFILPFVFFNGYVTPIYVLLFLILGLYEFLNIKKKANKDAIPNYIYFITFICSFLTIFDIPLFNESSIDYQSGMLNNYNINFIWVILNFILLVCASIFDKRFSIIDSFYCFATTFYLSVSLKGLLYLRSYDFNTDIYSGMLLVIYIFLVTSFTDIFAYIGGMLLRKVIKEENLHKLNERISPKKTIEGAIIGTILGTLCSFLFAFLAFKNTSLGVHPWYMYLILSFALSLFGQIGDLSLSAIKRYFEVKDFSNLLPGHGGILDRIDSLLINSIICSLFLMLI